MADGEIVEGVADPLANLPVCGHSLGGPRAAGTDRPSGDWDLAVYGTCSTPTAPPGLVGARPGQGARSGGHAGATCRRVGAVGLAITLVNRAPPRTRPPAPDPDRIDHRSLWAIVEYLALDGSMPALEEHASPLRPAGGAAASASLTVGIGAPQ